VRDPVVHISPPPRLAFNNARNPYVVPSVETLLVDAHNLSHRVPPPHECLQLILVVTFFLDRFLIVSGKKIPFLIENIFPKWNPR
jgi:hypothetical protein